MLTDDELKVLQHLTDFINAFDRLPTYHIADIPEMLVHVHALQNMVMQRTAVRAHPELFRSWNA